MATLWALLFLLLLLLVLLLHVFSLPANWILLGLVTIWKLAHSETMPWSFVLILVGIAAFGELAEFIAQAYGAKRFGSTGRGNFGGILGAILGAIVGAPFFFGLGAVLGALLGAYTGCYILEVGQGRSASDASHAAWGAFWGKFFGMAIKMGLGMGMLGLTAVRIWPA